MPLHEEESYLDIRMPYAMVKSAGENYFPYLLGDDGTAGDDLALLQRLRPAPRIFAIRLCGRSFYFAGVARPAADDFLRRKANARFYVY